MGWLYMWTAVLCLLSLRSSYSPGAGGTAARGCVYDTQTYQKYWVGLERRYYAGKWSVLSYTAEGVYEAVRCVKTECRCEQWEG